MEKEKYKQKTKQLKSLVSKDLEETVDIIMPFHICYKKMQHQIKIFLEKNYDLSKSELDLLISLTTTTDNTDTLAPTKLYEHLLFSSGGMTKLLRKLESKRYIIRVQSSIDKRSKLVKITKEGKELAKKAINEVVSLEAQFFSKLNNKEKLIIQKSLESHLF